MVTSPGFLDGHRRLGHMPILIIVGIIPEIFGKDGLFAGSPIELKIITRRQSTSSIPPIALCSAGMPTTTSGVAGLAMFIIGILIWIQRSYNTKLVDV